MLCGHFIGDVVLLCPLQVHLVCFGQAVSTGLVLLAVASLRPLEADLQAKVDRRGSARSLACAALHEHSRQTLCGGLFDGPREHVGAVQA